MPSLSILCNSSPRCGIAFKPHRHFQPSTRSLLLDVLVEDFANLVCALLGVSFLSALVVDVGDTESGRVAFGPFEVAVGWTLALVCYSGTCMKPGISAEKVRTDLTLI